MIMTKDKTHRSVGWTDRHYDAATELLSDGLTMIAATNDAHTVQEMADAPDADTILVGMVVPVRKAAAICKLLEEESGIMPSTVILLKNQESGDTTFRDRGMSRIPSHGESSPSEILKIKEITIDDGRHEVRVKNKLVTLTFSEYKILQTLAQKPGRVFSREKIIYAVHGDNYSCTERAVDVQVTGLRKKLGAAGEHIETVRGVGYRFHE